MFHFTFTGRWTNPESGKYLVELEHLNSTILADDSGFLEIGLNFDLRLPDSRTVLIDAGRLFFDENGLAFEAGKHQVEDGDLRAVCAALR